MAKKKKLTEEEKKAAREYLNEIALTIAEEAFVLATGEGKKYGMQTEVLLQILTNFVAIVTAKYVVGTDTLDNTSDEHAKILIDQIKSAVEHSVGEGFDSAVRFGVRELDTNYYCKIISAGPAANKKEI